MRTVERSVINVAVFLMWIVFLTALVLSYLFTDEYLVHFGFNYLGVGIMMSLTPGLATLLIFYYVEKYHLQLQLILLQLLNKQE